MGSRLIFLPIAAALASQAQPAGAKVLTVDYRKLVSRADLNYDRPASGSEEGLPVAGGFGAFVYGGEGAIKPLGSEPELKSRFLNFNRLASFIDSRGIGGAQIFRNRLRLREGPGAIDAEHIGGLHPASIPPCSPMCRRPARFR